MNHPIPEEFNAVKDADETILWVGKPELVPFLLTGVPFLIIGLIWGVFDLNFFRLFASNGFNDGNLLISAFMLIHLFPFYGSIFNMIRLALVHQNTAYAITSKRLMFKTGFFGIDFKAIDYDKIQNLEVNVNPLEKLMDVGTIRVFSGEMVQTKNGAQMRTQNFIAIAQPYEVFKKIKEVSLDIKSDLQYPNQYRPDENPGYNTRYNDKK